LAWVARGPDVVPIPGTRHAGRLAENVVAATIELTDDILERAQALAPPEAFIGTLLPQGRHAWHRHLNRRHRVPMPELARTNRTCALGSALPCPHPVPFPDRFTESLALLSVSRSADRPDRVAAVACGGGNLKPGEDRRAPAITAGRAPGLSAGAAS